MVRGDKKEGFWRKVLLFFSLYCHKSCETGVEGKEAYKPPPPMHFLAVESGVVQLGGGIGTLGKPHSGIVSNLGVGEDQSGEEEFSRRWLRLLPLPLISWLLLHGETIIVSSLVSSKQVVLAVGRPCGLTTRRSSSSSKRRSNLDVKSGMVSSNARQPDMIDFQ